VELDKKKKKNEKKKKLHHVKKKNNSNLMFYMAVPHRTSETIVKKDNKDTDTNQFMNIK
jgi:hypothetical protein